LRVSGEKVSISGASRAVGLGLTLLLGGLELGAVLGPWEDWPFSSAPMFARRQDLRAPVYYIEWYLRRGEERLPLSPQKHLGIGELPFRRGYFAAYYGSADPRHTAGHMAPADEAAFLRRQSEYCGRLQAAWQRRTGQPAPVFDLVVAEEVDGHRTLAIHVGVCDGGRFRRPP